MRKEKIIPLTGNRRKMTLRQMQEELDSIAAVEPNIEARLDRLFQRVGVLYDGDYRAYFNDLEAASEEKIIDDKPTSSASGPAPPPAQSQPSSEKKEMPP